MMAEEIKFQSGVIPKDGLTVDDQRVEALAIQREVLDLCAQGKATLEDIQKLLATGV
jgi:hypothetical protein